MTCHPFSLRTISCLPKKTQRCQTCGTFLKENIKACKVSWRNSRPSSRKSSCPTVSQLRLSRIHYTSTPFSMTIFAETPQHPLSDAIARSNNFICMEEDTKALIGKLNAVKAATADKACVKNVDTRQEPRQQSSDKATQKKISCTSSTTRLPQRQQL